VPVPDQSDIDDLEAMLRADIGIVETVLEEVEATLPS